MNSSHRIIINTAATYTRSVFAIGLGTVQQLLGSECPGANRFWTFYGRRLPDCFYHFFGHDLRTVYRHVHHQTAYS